MGGAVDAIEAQYMQQEIEQAAYAYAKDIDSGDKVVVGVNKFVDEQGAPTDVFPIDAELQRSQVARVGRVRAERDQAGGRRRPGRRRGRRPGHPEPARPHEGGAVPDGHARRGVRRAAGRVRRVPPERLTVTASGRSRVTVGPVGGWPPRPGQPDGDGAAAPADVPPTRGEDGVDDLVGPLALDPLVLHQVGLAAHAEPLQDRRRRGVAGVDASAHPVGAEPGEGQVDHGGGRLGGVAVAPVLGEEGVADLGQAVDVADPADPTSPTTSPVATTSTARFIHCPAP